MNFALQWPGKIVLRAGTLARLGEEAKADVRALVAAAAGASVKVIIETPFLNRRQKEDAALSSAFCPVHKAAAGT